MKIHPTAIIDKNAKLGTNVEVGPYSIIEGDVEIGDNCWIESCVKIYSGTRMGKNNKIHHTAIVGGPPQDLSFKLETKTYTIIGDDNVIREGVILHRATKEGKATTLGNRNYLMGQTHIAHDCILGDDVIMVLNGQIAGHCVIGNKVFISGLTGLHQFCKVGDYAMLAGCSKIVKDVPPFVTIDGNPATVIGLNSVGLKRAGFAGPAREKIKQTYKTIYHSGMNVSQALKVLKEQNDPDPNVQYIVRFFEESDRGVTDHR
ncbi:MAG TPA: acyl-ACP--UDP-N-acetylglucosamine O-acyltransferase [Leptospiraceae bacterium]|nr:acyl-ACP--UDP-N-acetylglucosamine O-acyltransferase [Leptospiraceae bacterium]HMY68490.1 acyl-ACP--UDP-N-acetylglucosamine O-acyltransferase [Leptospiraceae bacterium]HNF24585.1 acyl-ACP--UDP-N-acetylglucosamine O-acyltransferase [Leptospiraceae bacterium]HNH08357.1 acyl-ACP--UDP-N-acetylglucosamine O-acyltransferase [Leptospiraceae bacterium]HNI96666.1 acyl-ACP--UDP-N-acetylglucosamine O-acyltransferase [Leptospiraceae bacterium]